MLIVVNIFHPINMPVFCKNLNMFQKNADVGGGYTELRSDSATNTSAPLAASITALVSWTG
jgi:hypothetical protein